MTIDSSSLLGDPGAFAVTNHRAWIGRKEAKLRRHLLDCGCRNQGEVFFHLWCDRLACERHADAPHDCGRFKGKSGIEEESVEPEVFPAPQGAPVATGDSSPEGRRQFVADVAAFHAALVAGASWPPVEPEPAPPRTSFTLADMEEASAAVRARREEQGSMVEQASRAIEAAVQEAGFTTFTLDNSSSTFTPYPTVRITTLDGEEIYSGPVEPWPTPVPESVAVTYVPAEVECCGHTTPGLLGTRILFCTQPTGHEGDHRDDSGCSWSEIPRHSDSGRWHLIGTGDQAFEAPCDCPKPAAWWRRMLGGGTR